MQGRKTNLRCGQELEWTKMFWFLYSSRYGLAMKVKEVYWKSAHGAVEHVWYSIALIFQKITQFTQRSIPLLNILFCIVQPLTHLQFLNLHWCWTQVSKQWQVFVTKKTVLLTNNTLHCWSSTSKELKRLINSDL